MLRAIPALRLAALSPLLALALALSTAACGHAHPAPASTPTPPPATPSATALSSAAASTPAAALATQIPEHYRALAAKASTARELAFVRPLSVQVLPADEYHALLAQSVSLPTSDVADPNFRYAFGFSRFAPFTMWLAEALTSSSRGNDSLVQEQIVGFYAARSRALYVRRDAGGGNAEAVGTTVAHELAHALVDDHVALIRETETPVDDVNLARRALIEGDAVITAVVVKARRDHADVDEAVRRAALEGRVESAISLDGLPTPVSAAQLAKTNALDRARFLFPYQVGASFVGQIWRAGGPRAVDAALAAPPASTGDVLHPERYVRGDRPTEIASFTLPSGVDERARGRMGEMKTRLFLAQWMPLDEAEQAASGWAGDAYVVGTQGSMSIVAWATAWEDQAAAERFERALNKTTACERETPCLAGPAQIRRAGTTVAYVRGIKDEALVARVTASVRARPKPQPQPRLAGLTLKSLWVPKKDTFQSEEQRVCMTPRANVEVTAPAGFVFTKREGDDNCRLARPATGEEVNVLVLDAANTPAFLEMVKRGTRSTLRELAATIETEEGTRMTMLGRAHWVRYRIGPAVLETSLIGVCGGQKSIELVMRWSTESGRAAMEQVVAALRPGSVGIPEGCATSPRN